MIDCRLVEEARTLSVQQLFGRGHTFLSAWKVFEEGHRGQDVHKYLLKQARSNRIMPEERSSLSRDQQERKKAYRMRWSTLTFEFGQAYVDTMEGQIEQMQRKMELLQEAVKQEQNCAEQERARVRALLVLN